MAGCDFLNNLIKVISIVGPTASGKPRLSVELAKKFNGEIISADSMQIYTDMEIATAKPTKEEMGGIKHHLLNFLPVAQTYSVASFVEDAKNCISDISSRNKQPFIVGGTGLYVDSLLNNITFTDYSRNEEITDELKQVCEQSGVARLLEILSEFDPESARRLAEQKNPKRIIRAIEFYKTTGTTITEQNLKSCENKSPYNAVKIGLNFKDRQKLYDKINLRVDEMVNRGLVEEAKLVLNSNLSSTSAMAIGYKELIPYFSGEKSLEDCIEKLKQETRRYAKRQLTWFRRDKEINWLYVDEYNSFSELYDEAVSIIERG